MILCSCKTVTVATMDDSFEPSSLSTLKTNRWYGFELRSGATQNVKFQQNENEMLIGHRRMQNTHGDWEMVPYTASYTDVATNVARVTKSQATPLGVILPIATIQFIAIIAVISHEVDKTLD